MLEASSDSQALHTLPDAAAYAAPPTPRSVLVPAAPSVATDTTSADSPLVGAGRYPHNLAPFVAGSVSHAPAYRPAQQPARSFELSKGEQLKLTKDQQQREHLQLGGLGLYKLQKQEAKLRQMREAEEAERQRARAAEKAAAAVEQPAQLPLVSQQPAVAEKAAQVDTAQPAPVQAAKPASTAEQLRQKQEAARKRKAAAKQAKARAAEQGAQARAAVMIADAGAASSSLQAGGSAAEPEASDIALGLISKLPSPGGRLSEASSPQPSEAAEPASGHALLLAKDLSIPAVSVSENSSSPHVSNSTAEQASSPAPVPATELLITAAPLSEESITSRAGDGTAASGRSALFSQEQEEELMAGAADDATVDTITLQGAYRRLRYCLLMSISATELQRSLIHMIMLKLCHAFAEFWIYT